MTARAGRHNPPGQSSLAYRAGTYGLFLERMLARVHRQVLVDGDGQCRQPLRDLNLETYHDLPLAFLRAWALVGDVLTFYQERIANEGYLRTATERLSVLELVRTLGYRPRPGAAASTYLAFGVFNAKGASTRVTIPKGTAVRSIPEHEQMPVTFETSEDIEARGQWNALKPRLPTSAVHQEIGRGCTGLRLKGLGTGLKPGQPVLIAYSPENGGREVAAWEFRTLESVEPDRRQGYTLVTWGDPLAGPDTSAAAARRPRVEVYAMRQRAALFGRRAPSWDQLPDRLKQTYGTRKGGVYNSRDRGWTWEPRHRGLPFETVHVLASDASGRLFAGTDSGVFASTDAGESWVRRDAGLVHKAVHALARGAEGELFAGTAGGGVYRSSDAAESWEPIHGRPAAGGLLELHRRDGALPETVVRALAVSPDRKRKRRFLLTGTDDGILRSADNGRTWEPSNRGLAEHDAASGLANVVVRALVVDEPAGCVFAGTSAGVFLSDDHGRHWHPLQLAAVPPGPERLPASGAPKGSDTSVRALVTYSLARAGKSYLIVAADDGIYVASCSQARWDPRRDRLTRAGTEAPVAGSRVHCLLACMIPDSDWGYVLAGTDRGIFRSEDHAESWSEASTELRYRFSVDWTNWREALGADTKAGPEEESVAGGRWMVRSKDGRHTFTVVEAGSKLDVYEHVALTGKEVLALAAGQNGQVLIGTRYEGLMEHQWPGFTIEGDRIDLDRVYPGIIKGGWMVLEQHVPARLTGCYRVDSVSTVALQAFRRSGLVTHVLTSGDERLGSFDPRETVVHAQNDRLVLHEQEITRFEALSGTEITIQGAIDGLRPGQAFSISGKRAGARIAPLAGGVLRLGDTGWTPVALPGKDVRALVADGKGRLYAGTGGNGVFTLAESDDTWAAAGRGITQRGVRALVSDGEGHVYAATHGEGVLRLAAVDGEWVPTGTGLPGADVQALTVDGQGAVYAGTAGAGVFRWTGHETEWQAVSSGLSNRDVRALLVDAKGAVYAGTRAGGVFRSDNGGADWQAAGTSLAHTDVRALASDRHGRIYAASNGRGVFCAIDGGPHWRAVNTGLIDREVRSLAVGTDGDLYAGTHGGGVFHSSDEGTSWSALATGICNDVRALAIDSRGRLHAGAADAVILSAAGGLERDALRRRWRASLDVEFQEALDRARLTAALITRLRRAGLAVSERTRVVVATPGECWLLEDDERAPLEIHKREDALEICDPLSLEVAAAPAHRNPGAHAGRLVTWHLTTRHGSAGLVTAGPGEIVAQPAALDARDAREVIFLQFASIGPGGEHTTLVSVDPLEYMYDAATVTLCGNVVHATHGETVAEDLLGGGDASAAHQSFVLKRPPLTFVTAPTPSGAESTLAVEVRSSFVGAPARGIGELDPQHVEEGERWREVDTFRASGARSPHYTLSVDHEGRTIVTFGDGVHGARLPTRMENIVARYRSGLGEQGNCETGRLRVQSGRLPAVQRVTNPLLAAGGTEPESMHSAADRAPRSVRALERIVSLRDYEDFARDFTGIGAAKAKILWNGTTEIVHLTVAASDGRPLAKDTTLHRSLVEAIETFRLSPRPFHVESFELIHFHLAATVYVRPDFDPALVETAVGDALSERYAGAHQGLGEGVAASQVVALMQGIPDAVAVKLDALYPAGFCRSVAAVLSCAVARWDPARNEIAPAQRLVLDVRHGLELNVVETT